LYQHRLEQQLNAIETRVVLGGAIVLVWYKQWTASGFVNVLSDHYILVGAFTPDNIGHVAQTYAVESRKFVDFCTLFACCSAAHVCVNVYIDCW
jgi:hypothetical protein